MITLDNKPLRVRLSRSGIPEVDHIAEGVNNLLDEIEVYTETSLKTQKKLYQMELAKNEAEIYALPGRGALSALRSPTTGPVLATGGSRKFSTNWPIPLRKTGK